MAKVIVVNPFFQILHRHTRKRYQNETFIQVHFYLILLCMSFLINMSINLKVCFKVDFNKSKLHNKTNSVNEQGSDHFNEILGIYILIFKHTVEIYIYSSHTSSHSY